MTDRDKHIAHKKKEIEKIEKQQARLIKKVVAISPLTQSKRMDVNLRRLGKFIAIGMQIRALEMQKQMIIAQPIPQMIYEKWQRRKDDIILFLIGLCAGMIISAIIYITFK